VKVSSCNSRFLGGGRYVATTLPEEAQDRLTLELADEVGLTALEAVGMAVRQSPWDERPARDTRRRRSAGHRAGVA